MKIKEFFTTQGRNLVEGFKRFPLAYIMILVFAIDFDLSISRSNASEPFERIFAEIYATVAAFFTHLLFNRFSKKDSKRIVELIVTTAVTAISFWGQKILLEYATDENIMYPSFFYGTTILMMGFLSIRLFVREKNQDTVYLSLLSSLLFALIASFVLFVGLITCLFAFDSMIFSINEVPVFSEISIFCFFALCPILFLSQLPQKDEVVERTKRFNNVFIFLVIPCLVLLSILLIYIIKIITRWDMPSGFLNFYSSIVILVYLYVFMLLRGTSNRFLSFVIRWCSILIIPIVIVQIVGIVIRYNAYGLTPLRMAGMGTLVVGIYGLYLAVRNKPIKSIFTFAAIVTAILGASPFNIYDMSVRSQNNRIKQVFVKNNLLQDGKIVIPDGFKFTNEDWKTLDSAWAWDLNNLYQEEGNGSFVVSDQFSMRKPLSEFSKCKITSEYCRQCYYSINHVLGLDELIEEECFDIIFVKSKFSLEYIPVSQSNLRYISTESWRGIDDDKCFLYIDGAYKLKFTNKDIPAEVNEYDVTRFIEPITERAKESDLKYFDDFQLTEDESIWKIDDSVTIYVSEFRMYDLDTVNRLKENKATHSNTFIFKCFVEQK